MTKLFFWKNENDIRQVVSDYKDEAANPSFPCLALSFLLANPRSNILRFRFSKYTRMLYNNLYFHN